MNKISTEPRLPANPPRGWEELLNIRLYEVLRDHAYKINELVDSLASITLGDGPQLDAFNRLRVSSGQTLFDSQQEYGLDTLTTWDAAVYDASAATATLSITTASSNGSVSDGAGNAVGPTNANSRLTPITVTADDGDYAILQSRQYVRYIPGKSQMIFITGIFAPTAGSTMSLVLRTSTSGSVSDANAVAQSAWNVDKFDGTGPSGITLDFTKTQILVIDAQWLGVGRVRVFFDVDGILYQAHEFMNANVLAVPYSQSFNLPVRLEGRNSSGTIINRVGYFDSANGVFLQSSVAASGGTINFICCSVQSESGNEARGFPRTASNGATAIGVTTRRPVLSLRPKTTYNSRTNRGHIELIDLLLSAASNGSYFEVVLGGTLTGASWTSAGTNSIAEYDVSATAISGGTTLVAGFIASGTGSSRGLASSEADIRNPLVLSQIDALTATQLPISVVCTSLSGTSNITSALNWHEQVI